MSILLNTERQAMIKKHTKNVFSDVQIMNKLGQFHPLISVLEDFKTGNKVISEVNNSLFTLKKAETAFFRLFFSSFKEIACLYLICYSSPESWEAV